MKSKYTEMFDELKASDELKLDTYNKLLKTKQILQNSKMSSRAEKYDNCAMENSVVLKRKQEEMKMNQTKNKGRLAIWLSATAGVLAAAVIFAVVILPGMLGGGSKIRPLEDYKATVDGYLSLIKNNNVQGSAISMPSANVTSVPTIDDYNFKVETNSKTTYSFGDGYSFETESEGIIDGKKVKLTTKAATGEKETMYLDGEKYYFKVGDNWYYKYEDSGVGIDIIVSYYNDFLNPDLYDKTETKTEHIYTLKPDAVLPVLKVYEGLDLSSIDIKYDIVLKINEECLLFDITTTTTYLEDSIIFAGEKAVSEASQKLTLGGQTVTIPDDAKNAVEEVKWEDVINSLEIEATQSNNEITLTWLKPKLVAYIGYQITMYKLDDNEINPVFEEIELDTNTLTYTFTGLDEGASYHITFSIVLNIEASVSTSIVVET